MIMRAFVLGLALAPAAFGSVRITEWMYNGNDGEFIEFTNVGAAAVDMTGWSFDDDSATSGVVSLSAYGVVAPGESVILCEPDAATFVASWGLGASVKVIGVNAANLGRNDQLNLFDAGAALVDRLTFGDQNIPGTIRTNNISGWTAFANLGLNDVSLWALSAVGDAQNSYAGAAGSVGNPGAYVIPSPGAGALLSLVALGGVRRRR